MSDEKDILKDLFSEKLENYEAKVNPALWNSIASKIAVPAATSAVVGKTVLSKIIIGSSIAAAVAIGGYIFLTPSENTTTPTKETVVPKEQVSKSNTSKAFVEVEEAVVASQNKTKAVSGTFWSRETPISHKVTQLVNNIGVANDSIYWFEVGCS